MRRQKSLQVSGICFFNVEYVNPVDDPSRLAKR
jgi:hypothetical protein